MSTNHIELFQLLLEQVIPGQAFEKELIKVGTYAHPHDPKQRFVVTKERMEEWVKNFKNKVLQIVPLPLGHHPEEAMANAGLVEDLFIRGDALIGRLKVTLDEVAARIGKSILAVSVGIDTHFKSLTTGEDVGEVLEHVALTNIPHIQGLAPFQAVWAERRLNTLVASELLRGLTAEEEDSNMDAVKEEVGKVQAELGKKIDDLAVKALDAETKLTAERTKNEAMTIRVAELERQTTAHTMAERVDGLIRDGKIHSAQKETTQSLYMDGIGVNVEFEGKKMTLADKLYLLDQKREKIVTFGQMAYGNAGGENGDADTPEVVELGKLAQRYFLGEINEEAFKAVKKVWEDRAKKAGEVFPDERADRIKI